MVRKISKASFWVTLARSGWTVVNLIRMLTVSHVSIISPKCERLGLQSWHRLHSLNLSENPMIRSQIKKYSQNISAQVWSRVSRSTLCQVHCLPFCSTEKKHAHVLLPPQAETFEVKTFHFDRNKAHHFLRLRASICVRRACAWKYPIVRKIHAREISSFYLT